MRLVNQLSFIGERTMRYTTTLTTLRILNYQKLLFSLLISSFLIGDTTDINLDDLWDTVIWEEIEEINEIEGEVEQVISVAGVRGAESEDEALEHLYYRKSMKRLSQLELQKALGKLMKKKDIVKDEATLKKIDSYITQIKYKLRTY
jgi:hypothetical protein